jgi:transcriptional regulator with XRE-family HTH domain
MKASNEFITILQEQINTRMKEKNLTANTVEKKAGLKISAVRNILLGKSKNPGVEILIAIANTLECSVDELLGKNLSNSKQLSGNLSPHQKDQELCVWKHDLYKDSLRSAQNHIEKHKLSPTSEQMLFFVREIYFYSLNSTDNIADQRFTKWIIDNNI